MCQHQPPCPPADATDRQAAHVVASHPEQGWSLLCNGTVLFEDTGALLPSGQSIPPHRPAFANVPAPPAPALAERLTAHRAALWGSRLALNKCLRALSWISLPNDHRYACIGGLVRS